MDNNSGNNLNNNSNNGVIDMFSVRLRTYLVPLIFGYFLIKLFFATFGVYPKKYYNQTMTINSNDEDADKESVLNAYVPGLWNSELTDFLVMVMMSLILFFVKGNGRFPLLQGGGINYILWISFTVGLFIPVLKTQIYESSVDFDNFYSILIAIIGIFIVIYNLTFNSSNNNKGGYAIFTGLIILITVLLYIFKNKSNVFANILYNVRDKNSESCTRYDMENITVKSTGEEFSINIPFITWIVLLLFSFNNGPVNNIFNGILLGAFVGGVSFIGVQYPIIKTASDFCSSYEECQSKGIPSQDNTDSGSTADIEAIKKLDNQTILLQNRINVNSWTVIGISLTLMLVLLYLAIKMN